MTTFDTPLKTGDLITVKSSKTIYVVRSVAGPDAYDPGVVTAVRTRGGKDWGAAVRFKPGAGFAKVSA